MSIKWRREPNAKIEHKKHLSHCKNDYCTNSIILTMPFFLVAFRFSFVCSIFLNLSAKIFSCPLLNVIRVKSNEQRTNEYERKQWEKKMNVKISQSIEVSKTSQTLITNTPMKKMIYEFFLGDDLHVGRLSIKITFRICGCVTKELWVFQFYFIFVSIYFGIIFIVFKLEIFSWFTPNLGFSYLIRSHNLSSICW